MSERCPKKKHFLRSSCLFSSGIFECQADFRGINLSRVTFKLSQKDFHSGSVTERSAQPRTEWSHPLFIAIFHHRHITLLPNLIPSILVHVYHRCAPLVFATTDELESPLRLSETTEQTNNPLYCPRCAPLDKLVPKNVMSPPRPGFPSAPATAAEIVDCRLGKMTSQSSKTPHSYTSSTTHIHTSTRLEVFPLQPALIWRNCHSPALF